MTKKMISSDNALNKVGDDWFITDPQTGQQVPFKIALGRKQIKIENSLLFSVMLFGTLTTEQINEYVKMNDGKLTQNDKIAHYLYDQAGKHDKESIGALIDLNLAIAKRDKTTVINFTPDEAVTTKADSIIDKLEQELANITEAETTTDVKALNPPDGVAGN